MQFKDGFYIADSGKIFKRKLDNELLGEKLMLGIYDSIENYEEMDIPIEDQE